MFDNSSYGATFDSGIILIVSDSPCEEPVPLLIASLLIIATVTLVLAARP